MQKILNADVKDKAKASTFKAKAEAIK